MKNENHTNMKSETAAPFLVRPLFKSLLLLVAFYLFLHVIFGPPGAKKGIYWGGVSSEQEYWRLLKERRE